MTSSSSARCVRKCGTSVDNRAPETAQNLRPCDERCDARNDAGVSSSARRSDGGVEQAHPLADGDHVATGDRFDDLRQQATLFDLDAALQ